MRPWSRCSTRTAMASPSKLRVQNSISLLPPSNPCPPPPKGTAGGSQVIEGTLVAMFRWRYNRGSRMSAPLPNSGRPGPKTGTQTGSQNPDLSDGDEIPPEFDEKAQPEDEDGVMDDMATL